MSTTVNVTTPASKPTVYVTQEGDVTVDISYNPVGTTSGDVYGPASSTDNAIARFDGVTGKVIQNSSITIADGAIGTLSGSNSGDVSIGTANGLSLAGQALSLALSSSSTTGSLSSTDWNTFNSKQSAITTGNLTTSTTGVNITGGTGSVIGSGAAVNVQTANGSQPGLLSAADWNTFNDKQTAGNYITALTGDVTASGPGSAAATLANTAVNPGAYTNANITVDSKGRITAAANGSGGGSGTVTSVSVTTANGVSGTVANPTTTPAISLTLGAITPSSVASVGSVTGSNLSGTNTGDVSLASSVTDVLAVTGQSISGVDQGSDKLVFWDESANKLTSLTVGSGLSISGTTISSTGTGGDVVGPASSTDGNIALFDGATGKLIKNGSPITDYLTTAAAASTYQPLATPLTNFSALANSAGVLTNNGSGTLSYTATSEGGNFTSDAGKIARFDSFGNIAASLAFYVRGPSGPAAYPQSALSTAAVSFFESASNFTVLSAATMTGGKYVRIPAVGSEGSPATLISNADTGTVTNTMLANSAITINGTPVSLGGSTTIATGITIGSTAITGGTSGRLLTSGTTVGEQTLGTGVATALAVNVGSSGAFVANGGALGTPSSGTLTSCTGLPISTGVSGLGTNVATSLANNMAASGTLAILGANTFTGIQTLPAGSVSAPSLTLGDSGTGIYRSALNEFAITNNGTQRLRTTTSGVTITGVLTVGVGTIQDLGSGQLGLTSAGHYAFSSGFSATGVLRVSTASFGGGNYAQWAPLAAHTAIQRDGVNAQAAYVANTYTSTTNYEAGGSRWASNIFEFGTIKGSGGGTARAMRLMTDATARAVFEATTFNTTLLAGTGSYGSGSGVLFLGNATTAPTTDPTGGGIVYVEAGALKFRGSSGTVTTIAPA